MGMFFKATGGIAAALLIGGVPAVAEAQSAPSAKRIIRVPCDSTKLPLALTAAIGAGRAIVRLAPRCAYTVNATLGITSGDVAIIGGPSTTIKANPAAPPGPILNISPSAVLRITGLFIQGGSNPGNGGAIVDDGSLFLNFVTFAGNGSGSSGGALAVDGPGARAVVAHTLFAGNSAIMNGGALVNDGALTLFQSRVTGNAVTIPTGPSGRGGGVFTSGTGRTRIIQSTIDNNTSARLGGGVINQTGGVTSLFRSVVTQNKASLSAPNSGGGILNEDPSGGVVLRLTSVRRNSPDNCSGVVPGCSN